MHYERFGEAPPALLNKPRSNKVIDFYLKSFNYLSKGRAAGFDGPMPLNFHDICQFARLVGYTTADDILFFVDVLMECDSVYLKYVARQSAAESSG